MFDWLNIMWISFLKYSPWSGIATKEFDTVKVFRDIKEKMSLEMSKMSFDEIKEYLKKRSSQLQQQAKH